MDPLEANPRYLALTDAVFSWIERAGHEAVTSTITTTELLVPAYRDGDENKPDEFYGLLSTYPCGGLSRAWKPPILRRAFAEPIDFLRRMLFRRRLLCERKCQDS
jgi:hypothetical protein